MERRDRVSEISVSRTEAAGVLAERVEVRPLPTARTPFRCPVCRREDALVVVGDAQFCAACGYASDGAAGCT